ncbi:chloramphenicol acetyltransferase [Xinfangfangia sp. CPCC 101601]|uniref:Chloramphenicol acetyltransferase n=1 Tax=Pseudogemmobacter lacusdianii TaxID=3069608 RepID=A0ABU0W189_9RHOB|nr:chloramphenicol acetyltransferase [Xinfangfangia sp. CPCC 101601]MDQ2067774.1 chloramphenicol acetyltransferase [Xinfangfangia sp. CPCC 101601]
MTKLSSDQPLIHPGVQLENSSCGAWVELGEQSVILNSRFDDYAYCGRLCDIANSHIGKFANIASMCRIGPTDHPMDHASLHHFLYRSSYYWEGEADDAEFFARRSSRRTVIGVDTWLGHGVIVKPDVTIGTGAVIASGAIVTKDVPPYMIMAGVPAVPIRARFTPNVAERMLALAWWEWDHTRLQAALTDFRQLKAEAFLEKYSG